jgi:hypothetical protein
MCLIAGLSGTTYTWEVPESLVNLRTYALEITDGVTTNYGTQFQLIGGATASGTTSGTASVTNSVTQTGSVTSSATTSAATLSLSSTITDVSVSGSSTIRMSSPTTCLLLII